MLLRRSCIQGIRECSPHAASTRIGATSCQPRRYSRGGHVDAQRYFRRDERLCDDTCLRHHQVSRAALSGRDRGAPARSAGARQPRARHRCSAASPHSMQPISSSSLRSCSGPEGWQKGRHPELVDWLRSDASPRRPSLLGLLGHFPACRDRPLRRYGRDGALWLRECIRGRLSCGANPPGARAGHLRQTRGPDHFRRFHDMARSGAVP